MIMKMVGRKYEKKANKPIHLLKYNEHITIEKPKQNNVSKDAFLNPNQTAVVFNFAFLSESISGSDENKCIPIAQIQAANTNGTERLLSG